LRFNTYQEAQKHWSREQLIAYLKAHDWRNVEELADRLRKDWRVSKRGAVPVLDDAIPAGDIYERFAYKLYPHCAVHRNFEYDCIDCSDARESALAAPAVDHVFNAASGAI
jgi:hypothetical protein